MSALLQTPPDMSSCGSERVVSVEEAIAIGLAKAQPVAETELVGLHDAVGRILAQPVAANEPLPRFDYGAMDGYAVDTSSLTALSSGLNLRVSGTIAARSSAGNPELQHGCAIRILTGAPIPAGADGACPVPQ